MSSANNSQTSQTRTKINKKNRYSLLPTDDHSRNNDERENKIAKLNEETTTEPMMSTLTRPNLNSCFEMEGIEEEDETSDSDDEHDIEMRTIQPRDVSMHQIRLDLAKILDNIRYIRQIIRDLKEQESMN